jgi:hypothetical protein
MLSQYQSVRLPASLVSDLKAESDAAMRSTPKQIEFLIQLARAARDNPDLPIDFIESCMEAKNEIDAGLGIPFEFKR